MSNYLTLVNRVLQRINEVELNSTSFASAKGVHSLAKSAVNDVINQINTQKFEWPFNAYEHEQTLQIGVNEYAWPDSLKRADMESFEIQKSTSLGNRTTNLKVIDREQWYALFRDIDYDNTADGRSIPMYVFASHGTGFGVTPVPDKEYVIRYRYWITPAQLTNYDDETTIPAQFEYVIVDGALFIMNMFRGNDNSLGFINQAVKDGIKAMVNVYFSNDSYVWDHRVNF